MRKLREFQRLIFRSKTLQDQELLKINAKVCVSQFDELRQKSVLTKEQERDFQNQIKEIQNKIGPKISVPKTGPKAKQIAPVADEGISADERLNHAKFTEEILILSEKLKQNTAEIALANAEDAEILRTVRDNVEGVSNVADKNMKNFDDVVAQRLGWSVYYKLAIVVVIYMVVSFLFL